MSFDVPAVGIVVLAVATLVILVYRNRKHGKFVSIDPYLGHPWYLFALPLTATQHAGIANSNEKDMLAACPMSSVEPLKSFDWRAQKPLAFRPFKPVYHITMAVQNSSPQDLIVMDQNYEDRVLERRHLMDKHPNIVVGAIPRGRAAVEELYSFLLLDYLPQRFPTMFSVSNNGKTFYNGVTGVSFPTLPPDDSVQALRRLGETIEDDMFLLHETDEGHRSVAYVCCHPSGFDPSKKLDKLLPEIHKPVPSYEKIGPSMERYFKKLEVGKNVKRVNVSYCPIFSARSCARRSVPWGRDLCTDGGSMAVVRCRLSHTVQLQKQPRARRRS